MKHEVEDGGGTATMDRSGRQTGSVKSDAEKEEIQRKVEAAGTPGPNHKALEAFVGNWKAEVKCWHDKDGAAQVSQGTAKTKWILNGHFLEEEFQGEMMGKRFNGRTLIGFDNIRQAFKIVWISDMQTSIFTSEGKGEQGNKVITLEGVSDCPATGRRNIKVKTTYRVLSPDKYVFEMFDEGRRTMEITYSRQ
jgi:hypothetical protein